MNFIIGIIVGICITWWAFYSSVLGAPTEDYVKGWKDCREYHDYKNTLHEAAEQIKRNKEKRSKYTFPKELLN